MASSINRQVAQVLLRRLKAKETSHAQAVKLAELIARFQKLAPTSNPLPDTNPEGKPEDKTEEKPEGDVLGGL